MSQLTVVKAGDGATPPAQTMKPPPPNPFWGRSEQAGPKVEPPEQGDLPPMKAGVSEAKTTLDEGPVVIRWPSELSADSVGEFEYFLKGLIDRAKRKAGLSKKTQGNPQSGASGTSPTLP